MIFQMIDIRIAESLQNLVSHKKIDNILSKITQVLNVPNANVSLYITTNQELAQLNETYRHVSKPTDILSWSYFDESQECLGELALSWDKVRTQAKQNQWSTETEAIRLLVHGCVHLLGYDHQTQEEEREMLSLEKKVLARFQLENIYPEGTMKGTLT